MARSLCSSTSIRFPSRSLIKNLGGTGVPTGIDVCMLFRSMSGQSPTAASPVFGVGQSREAFQAMITKPRFR